MFLTVKDYTIPDFLSALGFVAPKGMSISYILAPDSIRPEAQNQIEAEGYVEQPALGLTNVKYLKKDLKQTHSFSPKANQIEDPNLLPPEMPKAAPVLVDPNLGNNSEIMTPKRGIVIAECVSADYEKSFALRENFCGIPKNTMIVFHESEEA